MNDYRRITEAIRCDTCFGDGTVHGPVHVEHWNGTSPPCEKCGGSGVMPGLEYAELEVTIDGQPYEYVGFTRSGDIPWPEKAAT